MDYFGKWTSSLIIKSHLLENNVPIPTVKNQPIQLIGLNKTQLPHQNIDENSELIKIQRTETPTLTTKILTEYSPEIIAQHLVEDELIVASDAALTTVYVESFDYIVDYVTGEIKRAFPTTTIPSASAAYIWYVPYTILLRDYDYKIDYNAGTVRRITGTTIPDSARLTADYSFTQELPSDDLIRQTIIEAENYISVRIASPDSNLDNQSIISAATYQTLSLIALSKLTNELNKRSSYSSSLCQYWERLANSYAEAAAEFAAPFLNASFPLDAGGAIQNRFTTSRSRTRISPSVPAGERKL